MSDDDNSAALLLNAVTRILVYVADDSDLTDFLAVVGGSGSTDIYDFTLEFVDDIVAPTVAQADPILISGLARELRDATDQLAQVIADTDFWTTLTGRILPNNAAGSEESYEIDAADAAVLSALYRKLRCSILLSIRGYDPSTFELLREDPTIACNDGFLAAHPDFFTVSSASAMAAAKSECAGSLDDLIDALDLMEAEVDAQGNDLLVLDDLPTGNYERDARAMLVTLRESFNRPTDVIPACDGSPFPIELGKFFDDPPTRIHLPLASRDPFTGQCHIDPDTFQDLSYNGALPSAPELSELEELITEGWPLCTTGGN